MKERTSLFKLISSEQIKSSFSSIPSIFDFNSLTDLNISALNNFGVTGL